MSEKVCLLEDHDNIGEALAWCGDLVPTTSDDPDKVTCLNCLKAFSEYAELVNARFDSLLTGETHNQSVGRD